MFPLPVSLIIFFWMSPTGEKAVMLLCVLTRDGGGNKFTRPTFGHHWTDRQFKYTESDC